MNRHFREDETPLRLGSKVERPVKPPLGRKQIKPHLWLYRDGMMSYEPPEPPKPEKPAPQSVREFFMRAAAEMPALERPPLVRDISQVQPHLKIAFMKEVERCIVKELKERGLYGKFRGRVMNDQLFREFCAALPWLTSSFNTFLERKGVHADIRL